MKILIAFLLIVAQAVAAEKSIGPLITSASWKWDHTTAKGRTMKFRPDGTCETTLWSGVWEATGKRDVTITQPGNLQTHITFSEDWSGFTGTHHDGGKIVGRRQGDVPPGLR